MKFFGPDRFPDPHKIPTKSRGAKSRQNPTGRESTEGRTSSSIVHNGILPRHGVAMLNIMHAWMLVMAASDENPCMHDWLMA